MKNYFVFGKRGTEALWNDDLEGLVEAIDDLEAEIFIYDPDTTPIHDVSEAYSRWSDYAYLTDEQYSEIADKI